MVISVEEIVLYVAPEATTLATPENLEQFTMELRTKKKIPTLKEALTALKKDLAEVGIEKWEATIEAYITVGTGKIIPGVEAGIKTIIIFSG